MEFLVSTPEINETPATLQFFDYLKKIAIDRPGFCYYKYPIAGGSDQHLPEIVIIDEEYGICAIDLYSFNYNDIQKITEYEWIVNNEAYDSPFLKLEDYKVNLLSKFQKYRPLRGKIKINTLVILPIINKSEMTSKFNDFSFNNVIFSNFLQVNYNNLWDKKSELTQEESRLFLSVSQGAGKLNDYKTLNLKATSYNMGRAISLIDAKISLLDKVQHAAAIQISDGPQRIRGMAGTGKTIILTMKAAILHSRFPDKKILYTFNTQSLYNQIKNLITKFYRESEEKDPNWDNLLVLHAWGGDTKKVYITAHV